MFDNMYRQDLIKFTWIMLICLIWFSVLFFALSRLKDGGFKKLVHYMSKKLTEIYVVQWLLIGWISTLFITEIPVYGHEFALLFTGIAAASFALPWLREKAAAKLASLCAEAR